MASQRAPRTPSSLSTASPVGYSTFGERSSTIQGKSSAVRRYNDFALRCQQNPAEELNPKTIDERRRSLNPEDFANVSLYSKFAYYLANEAVKKAKTTAGEQELLHYTTALQYFSNWVNYVIERVMEIDKDRTHRFYQQFYFSEDNSPTFIKDIRTNMEKDMIKQMLVEGIEIIPKQEGLGRDTCVAMFKTVFREGEP